MHFTLPEAAKECLLSVFHYTLWVAGTSEVDIRYLPINKSPVSLSPVSICSMCRNAGTFTMHGFFKKLELSFETVLKRVSIYISMKSPSTAFTHHLRSPPLVSSAFELDAGIWGGVTTITILMERTEHWRRQSSIINNLILCHQ